MFQYTKSERPGIIEHRRFTASVYMDTEYGVVRWSSSDNIPPQDTLRDMAKQGLISWDVEEATNAKRAQEDQVTLREHREFRERYGYSDEEKAEMRAEFGSDVVVVDVITGKRILL
jgi:hypothetical protein